ncbi:hypothetical protein CXK93_11205 [Stutzerimonas decontaminans]|jgi:hypothetical protein|uniref:LapA family protein n=2 Tax=Stutzerimonas TaxID=2901164 RepID=A0ABX4VXY4_9GAMM|nr:hypothetical protein [Stutzerimonas decontaminans]AHY43657.1 hypothetical protein UIB01_14675 [Stutzerimonas decontaminans]MCQ4245779.1 hypothetical protein [Stutzerimonas decontaminans]MCW8156841.1 hypothetical protein [Stutzerimonas stutzeri]PNF84837.1 hypothetical protein CXK93_11205 [Stutzerimonas decontaminans]
MFSSYLYEAALIYGLVFTSVGFVLGMFYNNRKVFQLEEKVQRLKRTVRHLQRKVEPSATSPQGIQRGRSSAGLSSVR